MVWCPETAEKSYLDTVKQVSIFKNIRPFFLVFFLIWIPFLWSSSFLHLNFHVLKFRCIYDVAVGPGERIECC